MTDAPTGSAAPQELGSAALFVRRPILAVVVNLLVIIAGLAALAAVEVRELPNVSQPVITVTADYSGAAPSTIDSEVTRVLEDALARLEGLEHISSQSTYGRSRLTLDLSSATDPAVAASDARELIAGVRRDLPDDVDEPIVQKNDADADPVLRLALTGALSLAELTTLAEDLVSDRLTTIEGVAEVEVTGGQDRIMRVTFSPIRLASHGISVADVREALASANLDIPLGALETATQALVVRSEASTTSVEAISAIRLNRQTVIGDIAFVQDTADDPDQFVRINGQPAVGLNVRRQSHANSLSIALAARDLVDQLQRELPEGATLTIIADEGVFVERAIAGVVTNIAMAVVIVVFVIFLFLRSLRAVIVPAVAVPIALVGTLAAIWITGFTVNTITLLALVLATGMVVDDAIVVLENIIRKRREGLGAYAAAAVGAREVFFAVISTTATLAAVFIPISFLPGQAGGIFGEFGFVLAFAVALSSFVALTLCPMLCAQLDPGAPKREVAPQTETEATGLQSRLLAAFDAAVAGVIAWRLPVVVVALGFAVAAMLLYTQLPQELTPPEDRGTVFIQLRTPPSASLDYTGEQVAQIEAIVAPLTETGEVDAVLSVIGFGGKNTAFVIIRMAPWEDRTRSQQEIAAWLQGPLRAVPGALIALRSPNSLRIRGAGSGLQFAVVGNDYERLEDLTIALVDRMARDPAFINPQLTYDINQPQLSLTIDRALAANLGIAPRSVVETLYTMIEGDEVAEIFVDNQAIDIKLVAGGRPVNDQGDLENTFVVASNGQFVPASTVAQITEAAAAATLTRESRQRAVAAQANLGPGVDLGGAADRLREIAEPILDDSGRLVFLGEAATLEGGETGTLLVFAAALLIVFLVLAAQFESFVNALVILITVPCGLGTALLAIWLSGGSLNYYSQIGLVLLVGIMAKNGILIVEFANQLRGQGRDVDSAIRDAMRIRLKPVIMTMASTVCGSIPLVLASGAGAEARIAVGWVVVGGLGLATLFTLFLTPAVYRIIAPLAAPPGAAARKLKEQLQLRFG